MDRSRAEILTLLRDQTMALPEVVERAVYDGFCREWTPAYYIEDRRVRRQLFHVHDFPTGLRGTVFVGVRTLEPVLLNSTDGTPELKEALVQTKGARTKQLRVPLASPDDAARFAQMVQVKWQFQQGWALGTNL
ncbi:MAG: hypothetical protein BZY88_02595 [SAR202 cluster bacterium Io17-Chloro-G9]|nr:MAG: hypothetical protein BZY88_02595 [SAR202 cluster bacterium Io17-Chloro-G9]